MCNASPLNKVLLGAVLALVAANILLLASLWGVERRVKDAAMRAVDEIERVQERLSATSTPIRVSVDEIVMLPVRTSVPINTVVSVPVVIPLLGQQVTIAVPINTTVPIETTLRIPVKTSIPVNVDSGVSVYGDILERLRQWLSAFASSL